MQGVDPHRLRAAFELARDDLLAQRRPEGYWVGELSSSALATATATSALAVLLRHRAAVSAFEPSMLRARIQGGVAWLARTQNADGGWGDTPESPSNIATTMLVKAAMHLAGAADCHAAQLARAFRYIEAQGGIAGLRRRYGKDKTFAAPILANCALAGLVPWHEVDALPFELACLPRRLLGMLRIPVVSYAIPALVAIGQVRHVHARPRNPVIRRLRDCLLGRTLSVAERMQPASGGFLEAVPLTSFVVMSVADTGRAEHGIVQRGVRFLLDSVRGDGSWPIDTNLATWVTTLAIGALAGAGEPAAGLISLDWLLGCQHRQVHPFTEAAPGGWGWSDLSGAVPDADDTAGALLALAALRKALSAPAEAGRTPHDRFSHDPRMQRIDDAARQGIVWLLNLQNGDGGIPTFCRGWGALPFDRSGVDLTAHALRAWWAWRPVAASWGPLGRRMDRAMGRAWAFLVRQQRPDGSWVPLWFGNQYSVDEQNFVYGTSRVLQAMRDLGRMHGEPARRAVQFLVEQQGADGGWGGGWTKVGGLATEVSSVEETALAVEALLAAPAGPGIENAVARGLAWLVHAVETGRYRRSTPIGLYFARLWYDEKLYPRIFVVSALGRACGAIEANEATPLG